MGQAEAKSSAALLIMTKLYPVVLVLVRLITTQGMSQFKGFGYQKLNVFSTQISNGVVVFFLEVDRPSFARHYFQLRVNQCR